MGDRHIQLLNFATAFLLCISLSFRQSVDIGALSLLYRPFALGYLYIIFVDVLIFAVLSHVSRRKIETVVGHGLNSEVIQADRLLQVATAINLPDEHLFCEVIVVEIAAHRLAIVHL